MLVLNAAHLGRDRFLVRQLPWFSKAHNKPEPASDYIQIIDPFAAREDARPPLP